MFYAPLRKSAQRAYILQNASTPPISPQRPLSAFTKRWKLHFSLQKS